MFKQITLLKRRPGMSMAEFMDYYERHHSRIGVKYLKGAAVRYVRRYLFPVTDPLSGEDNEPEHDVIMEIWFPDKAAYDATLARLTRPEVAAEIIADEERLFDRSKHRYFFVEERESAL